MKFKKIKKSFLSVLLVFTMLAGMLPLSVITANAAEVTVYCFQYAADWAAPIPHETYDSTYGPNSANFFLVALKSNNTNYNKWFSGVTGTSSGTLDPQLSAICETVDYPSDSQIQKYDVIKTSLGVWGFVAGDGQTVYYASKYYKKNASVTGIRDFSSNYGTITKRFRKTVTEDDGSTTGGTAKASSITVTDITDKGYRVTCTLTNLDDVAYVEFPTWTAYKGNPDKPEDDQDDIVWHRAERVGNTTSFTYYVNIKEHNYETGKYYTHIYVKFNNVTDKEGLGVASDGTGDKNCININPVSIGDELDNEFYAYINLKGLVSTDDLAANSEPKAKTLYCSGTSAVVGQPNYTDSNQIWHFRKLDNGYYSIANYAYEKSGTSAYLSVTSNNTSSDRDSVGFAADSSSSGSQWRFNTINEITTDGQYYYLVPKSTVDAKADKVLNVSKDGYTSCSTAARVLKVGYTSESSEADTTTNNMLSQFRIDIIREVDNNTTKRIKSYFNENYLTEGADNLPYYKPFSTDVTISSQMWTFVRVNEGVYPPIYNIINKGTGNYLQASDTTDVTAVTASANGQANQKWMMIGSSDNRLQFLPISQTNKRDAHGTNDPNEAVMALGTQDDEQDNTVRMWCSDYNERRIFFLSLAETVDNGNFYSSIVYGKTQDDGYNYALSMAKDSSSLVFRKASATPAVDQMWYFKSVGNYEYVIQNLATGLVLGINGNDNSDVINNNGNSKTIQSCEYDGSGGQKWYIVKQLNGTFSLRNRLNYDYIVDVPYAEISGDETNNLKFGLASESYSPWTLNFNQTTTVPSAENLGDTFWAYISPASDANKYLHCSDAVGTATPPSFQTITDDTAKRKQENYWKFVRNDDGSYSISSCNLQNALLTKDGSFGADTSTAKSVYLANATTDSDLYNQRWFIRKYAGGYKIESKMNGQVFSINSGALNSVKNDNSGASETQLFDIVKTDLSLSSDMPNVKMRLFNYGRAINGTSDAVLPFFNNCDKARFGMSYVDNDNNNALYTGVQDIKPTMEKTLKDGYPVVSNNNIDKCTNETVKTAFQANGENKGGSLKYLFDDTKSFVQGSGSAESYNLTKDDTNYITDSDYQSQCFTVNNPSSLFRKCDENGLYYYDSLLSAAYFQRDTDSTGKELTTGNFKLYDYTMTLPLRNEGSPFLGENDNDGNYLLASKDNLTTTTGIHTFSGNFFPFNIAHESGNVDYDKLANRQEITTTNDYVKNLTYAPVNYIVNNTEPVDCWFGMTLECEFEQTSDGQFDGKDVQFNFKGDDDVWVYIDDVLVLDIGGTHSALEGSINFATGEVKYPKDVTGTIETTNLKQLFIEANASTEDFNTDTNTFKSGTKHKLNFFYLERGGTISYCQINFNLPKGTPSVTKEVTNANADFVDQTEYEFLIEKYENNQYVNFDSSDKVTYLLEDSINGTSEDDIPLGSDGKFKLKAGQTAYFHNIETGTKYRVTEIGAKTVSADTTATYTTNESGVSVEGVAEKKFVGDDYVVGPIELLTNVTQDIKFKNTLNTASLTIDKDVVDANDVAINSMPDSVYNFGLRVYKNNDDGTTTEYGTIDFSIKGTELSTGKTINNLPVGASYDLWEYYPTDTSNRYDSPTFTDGNKTVTGRLVEPSNTPSTNDVISGTIKEDKTDTSTEPATVTSGNNVTVTNKLLDDQKITLTLKYYDRKVVSGEVANINEQETAFSKQVDISDYITVSGNTIKNINFVKMITDLGVCITDENKITNVVDDYELFTSQATAVDRMSNESDPRTYTLGINDIDAETGKPFASHTIDADDAVYHTNSKRQPITDLSKQEKWVTYYNQSNEAVDAEATNFIDFDKITNVTVWLYNTPHKYTVTTHVPDETKSGDTQGKIVYFDAYYNQLIGSYDGTGTSGSELEFYKDEYEYYCDKYSIPLNEYDARGYTKDEGGNPSAKTYTYSGALGQVGEENFSFWTDGADANSSEVISTDRYYNYRVIRDIHLYAQYGEKKQGVATTSNGIDTYYTSDGTKKLRLNTVMNPYGFPDGKENGNEKIDYTFVAYLDLGKNYGDHTFTTDEKNTLSDIIKTAVNQQLDLNDFPSNGRKVIYADAVIGTTNYGRFVIVVDKIDNSRVKLTNKNRIQFVTSYTANEANNGKRILAFTGMRYNDSSCITDSNNGWFVSTGFADHKLNY